MYMVDTFLCKICILITGNQNNAEPRHTNPNHVKIMLSLSSLDMSCFLIEQQCSQNSVGFNKIGFCFSTCCCNFKFYIVKSFF